MNIAEWSKRLEIHARVAKTTFMEMLAENGQFAPMIIAFRNETMICMAVPGEGDGRVVTATAQAMASGFHADSVMITSDTYGANRLDKLCARVKELGMPAVAVTDHGNIFGAAAFYLAAKEAGVEKAALTRLFPQGPLSLVELFSDTADAEMEKNLAAMDQAPPVESGCVGDFKPGFLQHANPHLVIDPAVAVEIDDDVGMQLLVIAGGLREEIHPFATGEDGDFDANLFCTRNR